MCIFEIAEVLWLCGIRGSNLTRPDLESGFAETSARQELFI
jgi:hypothetical protein